MMASSKLQALDIRDNECEIDVLDIFTEKLAESELKYLGLTFQSSGNNLDKRLNLLLEAAKKQKCTVEGLKFFDARSAKKA